MARLFIGLAVMTLSAAPLPAEAQNSPQALQAQRPPAPLCVVDSAAGCRTAVDSFAELSAVLKPGQQIIVTDESGRSRRGKIVSITPNEVVIDRERLLRRRTEDRFDDQGVDAIRYRDSTANGVLLGMLGGVAVTVAKSFSSESRDGLEEAMLWFGTGPALILGGALVGQAVDAAVNDVIYKRPVLTPAVRLLPFAARRSAGLALVIRY